MSKLSRDGAGLSWLATGICRATCIDGFIVPVFGGCLLIFTEVIVKLLASGTNLAATCVASALSARRAQRCRAERRLSGGGRNRLGATCAASQVLSRSLALSPSLAPHALRNRFAHMVLPRSAIGTQGTNRKPPPDPLAALHLHSVTFFNPFEGALRHDGPRLWLPGCLAVAGEELLVPKLQQV